MDLIELTIKNHPKFRVYETELRIKDRVGSIRLFEIAETFDVTMECIKIDKIESISYWKRISPLIFNGVEY